MNLTEIEVVPQTAERVIDKDAQIQYLQGKAKEYNNLQKRYEELEHKHTILWREHNRTQTLTTKPKVTHYSTTKVFLATLRNGLTIYGLLALFGRESMFRIGAEIISYIAVYLIALNLGKRVLNGRKKRF